MNKLNRGIRGVLLLLVMSFVIVGCNEPQNSKKHDNVKVTVIDAYQDGQPGSGGAVRLIAMTNLANYPVAIYVEPYGGKIDEITLMRFAKKFKHFTFQAKILHEDLNIEHSMSFYLNGSDIKLFPNNDVNLKVVQTYTDMTPIIPGGQNRKPAGHFPQNVVPSNDGSYNPGGGGAAGSSATNTNTFTINVNGDGPEEKKKGY